MSVPAVSVIIPVYNVEPYLRCCLDSVVNQTLRDIEIICINDASTDNSGKILDEYVKRDNHIKIITHDQNRGLSAARNSGIAAARGKYIGFIDSDDWVDLDYYERLYDVIETYRTDIVRNLNAVRIYGNKVEKKYKGQEGLYMPDDYYVSACIHLIKKTFLDQFDTVFPEKLKYEDNYFWCVVVRSAGSIYSFSGGCYYHFQRPDSIIGMGKPIDNYDIIENLRLIYEYYRKYDLLSKFDIPLSITLGHLNNHINPEKFLARLKILFKKMECDVLNNQSLYNWPAMMFFNDVLNACDFDKYRGLNPGQNGKFMLNYVRRKLQHTGAVLSELGEK